MIVVTAGGGRTGATLTRALRARGRRVRAIVSTPGPRPELDGADVVVADPREADTVGRHLADAEALYVIWPNFAPGEAAGAAALFAASVSPVDVGPDGPVPPASDHAAHCLRQMSDHYRAHGFAGSPRVPETLLGRPARPLADHLADHFDDLEAGP